MKLCYNTLIRYIKGAGMITKEVNNWIRNVECGMYSDEDVMYEFSRIAKYLTREELVMIKRKLSQYIK